MLALRLSRRLVVPRTIPRTRWASTAASGAALRGLKSLNADESVSGILVQLPLGSHVGAEGERTVTEAVSPEKDVDGYVLFALGALLAQRILR